ncbi:MAG: hypothetical protein IJP53_01545 [Synergistaceae bacterium]|nr:hypothetical protein [Synergistaceae bacterium]MBR0094314.1 hypothetical protein [Synergistaceae bacterium]
MKRKIFLCALMLLVLASAALARPQAFGNFRAEIPAGWSGDLQGSTLVIKNDTAKASLAVAFNEMGEASLTDIVERLYVQMDGRDLEQDDDGDYNFSFVNMAGAESVALISGGDGYYLVVSMSGFEDEALHDDFETILDSIDWED